MNRGRGGERDAKGRARDEGPRKSVKEKQGIPGNLIDRIKAVLRFLNRNSEDPSIMEMSKERAIQGDQF